MNRRNFFTLALCTLGAVVTGRAQTPKPTPTPSPTPLPPSNLRVVPDPPALTPEQKVQADMLAAFDRDFQRWLDKYGHLFGKSSKNDFRRS
ncbi:MAG TPA: hypothetical protein VFO40_15655 [Chthoniobacterales bacterium]|nr:hypothetical protein [Chthoniobacterales bacterium]